MEIKSAPQYTNSSVVVIGGSYSATMAAWFRQKYPHLAVGAWASSAPVLAQVDFKEYMETVGQSIVLVGGKKCMDAIVQGYLITEELLRRRKYTELKKTFNLCDDFDANDQWNVWNLFDQITEVFAGTVQGHR